MILTKPDTSLIVEAASEYTRRDLVYMYVMGCVCALPFIHVSINNYTLVVAGIISVYP